MELWELERLERLRKEQQRKPEQQRPVLHAPRPQPPSMWEELPQVPDEKPPERGVVIIDFNL
jgi:hypothetical protein